MARVAAAYLSMLLGQQQTLPLCERAIFMVSTWILDENFISTKFIGLFDKYIVCICLDTPMCLDTPNMFGCPHMFG